MMQYDSQQNIRNGKSRDALHLFKVDELGYWDCVASMQKSQDEIGHEKIWEGEVGKPKWFFEEFPSLLLNVWIWVAILWNGNLVIFRWLKKW